ncbi:MAG: hypothetical protein ACR5LF_04115 [Symbiopectobacterium sp.]
MVFYEKIYFQYKVLKKWFVLSLLGACIAVSSQAGAAALPAVVNFTENGKVCDVTQYDAEGHRLQVALNTDLF